MTATRTATTTLVALALAALLALPAAAASPVALPVETPEGVPGNPVAHCLPDDDAEVPEEDDVDVPEEDDVDVPEEDDVDVPEEDDVEVPEEEEVEVPEETEVPEDEEIEVPEEEETEVPDEDDDLEQPDEEESNEEDDADDSDVADCVLASLPDIVGNTHAASMVAVVASGIAAGYPDGTFRPQQSVTRGQMATFLARALELAPEQASGLRDVAGDAHEESIDAVVAAGIAEGYTDGTFRPRQEVSRAQMATFLARALELAPEQASGLRDVAGNTHQAAIDAVVGAGIAQGYADGTFRPQQEVTRAQMSSFLTRALGL